MGRVSSRFLSKTHHSSLDCRVSLNVRDCGTHAKFSGPEFQSMIFALHPLYVLSGFAVGFLVGMTGVGGGSLMTPLLILLFHVHPTTAVGTDLLYASITKSWRHCGAWHCPQTSIGASWDGWRWAAIPAALLTLVMLHLLKDGSGDAQWRGHQGAGLLAAGHRTGAGVPQISSGFLFPPRRRIERNARPAITRSRPAWFWACW